MPFQYPKLHQQINKVNEKIEVEAKKFSALYDYSSNEEVGNILSEYANDDSFIAKG